MYLYKQPKHLTAVPNYYTMQYNNNTMVCSPVTRGHSLCCCDGESEFTTVSIKGPDQHVVIAVWEQDFLNFGIPAITTIVINCDELLWVVRT